MGYYPPVPNVDDVRHKQLVLMLPCLPHASSTLAQITPRSGTPPYIILPTECILGISDQYNDNSHFSIIFFITILYNRIQNGLPTRRSPRHPRGGSSPQVRQTFPHNSLAFQSSQLIFPPQSRSLAPSRSPNSQAMGRPTNRSR